MTKTLSEEAVRKVLQSLDDEPASVAVIADRAGLGETQTEIALQRLLEADLVDKTAEGYVLASNPVIVFGEPRRPIRRVLTAVMTALGPVVLASLLVQLILTGNFEGFFSGGPVPGLFFLLGGVAVIVLVITIDVLRT